MSTEKELEIKIRNLTRPELRAVFKHYAKKVKREAISKKVSTSRYFDTKDFDLDARHMTMRTRYKRGVRGRKGVHEQTLKREVSDGSEVPEGSTLRDEIKDIVDTAAAELSRVTDPQAREEIKSFANKKLKKIFTIKMKRLYFNLEAGKGKKKGTVELAFETGKVFIKGFKPIPFVGIELEKKGGSAKALTIVKKHILKRVPGAIVLPLSKGREFTKVYKKLHGIK